MAVHRQFVLELELILNHGAWIASTHPFEEGQSLTEETAGVIAQATAGNRRRGPGKLT